MPIRPFLAMTPSEIQGTDPLPPKIAWMACHFSPWGTGLTNLPPSLPPGSVLVVDDWTPPEGHAPEVVLQQLTDCVQKLQCRAVLLDFQRPGNPESEAITQLLSESIPCPVVASDVYAGDLSCPVFLPPVPPSVTLTDYLSPWDGRELWLELALTQEVLLLTENGCNCLPEEAFEPPQNSFEDEGLRCHYQIQPSDSAVRFTLWRTPKDLESLCREAESLGVAGIVGLYQELRPE